MARFGEFCPAIGEHDLPDGTIVEVSVDMAAGLLPNRAPSNGELRCGLLLYPFTELEPEERGLEVRFELVVLLLLVANCEDKSAQLATLLLPFLQLLVMTEVGPKCEATEVTTPKGRSQLAPLAAATTLDSCWNS